MDNTRTPGEQLGTMCCTVTIVTIVTNVTTVTVVTLAMAIVTIVTKVTICGEHLCPVGSIWLFFCFNHDIRSRSPLSEMFKIEVTGRHLDMIV